MLASREQEERSTGWRGGDEGSEALTVFARQCVQLGRSVSVEHGLVKRKARFLPIQYSAERSEAMERRFDPEWRFGRGTLFEPPATDL